MLDTLNDICLRTGDFLFGWLLNMPVDIVIVVAISTSAILTFIRLLPRTRIC